VFKSFLKKKFSKKLLLIYAKHKNIIKKKNFFINNILDELTVIKLSDYKKNFYLNNIKIHNIEIYYRQFCLDKLIASNLDNFKKKLFLSFFNNNDSIVHPMPIQWIFFFKKKGLKINTFFSLIFFFKQIVFQIIKGFYQILHTLLEINNNNYNKKYYQFCDLPDSVMPQSNKENYNLFNWIKKNEKPLIFNIFTNSSIFLKKYKNFKLNKFNNPVPALQYSNRLYFLFKSLIIFFYIFPKIFKLNKWHELLFFRQLILALKASCVRENNIAQKYFFSQSSYIYKPLWAGIFEKYGSEIVMFFYAGGFNGYYNYNKQIYDPLEIGYKSMTWSKIYIWTLEYYKFLQKECKDSNFILVDPIYYRDQYCNIKFKKKSLVLFDVTPERDALRFMTFKNNIISFNNVKKFIEDILFCANEIGITVYLKPRRLENQNRFDRKYFSYVQNLKNFKNLVIIKENISPFFLIKKVKLVISYPFTSVGFLGKFYNKKSFFYDPSDTIYKKDRASQNEIILSNRKKLREYLKKIYK
jgi:polysaccharide biosynthesis PFTS motif protein